MSRPSIKKLRGGTLLAKAAHRLLFLTFKLSIMKQLFYKGSKTSITRQQSNRFGKLFVLVLISCMLFGIYSCKRELSDMNQQQAIRTEVISLIQQNLSAEYKLLATQSQAQESALFVGFKTLYIQELTAQKDFDEIVAHRNSLQLDNLVYTASNVSVNEKETTVSSKGDSIYAQTSIMYQLPTNSIDADTHEQIVTEGTAYYDFTFVRKKKGLYIMERHKVPDFPLQQNNSEEAFRTSVNDGLAKTEKNYLYNAPAAVTYALKYYKTPNKDYADYSSQGGDCTNFLSQCLKAGGWIQVNKWHWISDGKSCDDNMTFCKRSPGWSGAYKFYEYINNNGAQRVSQKFANIEVYYWYSTSKTREKFRAATSVLNKGDIVQLAKTANSGTVHHSTIVTSKDEGAKQIFVTYRNADGYPVAKNKYIGDFGGGQYLHGFAVKAIFTN